MEGTVARFKSVSGSTGGAYSAILSWYPEEMKRKVLLLTNTHVANALKYRIRAYPSSDGSYYNEIWAETVLPALNSQVFMIQVAYSYITVEVAIIFFLMILLMSFSMAGLIKNDSSSYAA